MKTLQPGRNGFALSTLGFGSIGLIYTVVAA